MVTSMGYSIRCKHPTIVKIAEQAALTILKANFDTPSSLMFQEHNWLSSWPSRAWKKKSVGIFEYILASMLKVYLDVF